MVYQSASHTLRAAAWTGRELAAPAVTCSHMLVQRGSKLLNTGCRDSPSRGDRLRATTALPENASGNQNPQGNMLSVNIVSLTQPATQVT